jgi:nitrate/nitrite transporter NarK
VVIDPYQQQLIKVTATIQIGSNKEQQIVPNEYFSTKLGLAQGLIKAGGGLGGAALSLGLDAMIQKLGVSWAFRILGAITLAAG